MSTKPKNRIRLDQLLIERELFESRTKAQAAIMSGAVFVNRQKSAKSGTMIDTSCLIEIKGKACPYVSRGGFKLEHALKEFNINVKGKVCLDIGASTGGFTDCLLQNGAKAVYAVDVGYGQIAWKLRQDKRIIVIEKTNARYLTVEMLEKALSSKGQIASRKQEGLDSRAIAPGSLLLASMDVSFISITKILPAIYAILEKDGQVVSLVKPQFEAGRGEVPRGGVVKDPKIHQKVLDCVKKEAEKVGFGVRGECESPILGADGNREFFVWLEK